MGGNVGIKVTLRAVPRGSDHVVRHGGVGGGDGPSVPGVAGVPLPQRRFCQEGGQDAGTTKTTPAGKRAFDARGPYW